MARINNGFLGNATGKIGNVVFSKWNGINTARAYVAKISDSNSPAQQIQRLRMASLQAFLSPVNKTYIAFFNKNIAHKSSPWAVAIKQNMPAVDPLGFIDIDKIKFGAGNIPAVSIKSSFYDPFIDCVTIIYDFKSELISDTKFPLFFTSMLGISKEPGQPFDFNQQNLLQLMPAGAFTCVFEDQAGEYYFNNYFDRGLFWIMPVVNSRWDDNHQTPPPHSDPTPFSPIPIVEKFNKLDLPVILPPEAFSLVVSTDSGEPRLKLELAASYVADEFFLNVLIHINAIVLTSEGPLPRLEFSAAVSDFPLLLTKSNTKNYAGTLFLYHLTDLENIQISSFTRFFENQIANDYKMPYFNAIFNFYNAPPLSFSLPVGDSAFCGNIDDLIPTFIKNNLTIDKDGQTVPFDYSMIKISILDSNAKFIKEASIRANHDFFCNALSTLNNYIIVISFHDTLVSCFQLLTPELIDIWKKPPRLPKSTSGTKSKIPSRPRFLHSSVIVSIHNISIHVPSLYNTLKTLYPNLSSLFVPLEDYQKEALISFETSNPDKYKKTFRHGQPLIFNF